MYLFRLICVFVGCILYCNQMIYARSDGGTERQLSDIRGADMTIYDMYLQARDKNYMLAMEYLDTFLSGIDSSACNPELARLQLALSDYYEDKRSLFSKSVKWKLRALSYYKSVEDMDSVAIVSTNLAESYCKMGNYSNTLRYSFDALSYFEEHEQLEYAIKCYELLGIVCHYCNDSEGAKSYYQKYVQAAKVLGDSLRIIIGLNNSSVIADGIGDTTKSRQLITESGKLCQMLDDTVMVCKIYLNLLDSYLNDEKFDNLEYLFDSMRSIVPNNIECQGRYCYCRARYYLKARKYDKAFECLDSAILFYSKGELGQYLQKCYNVKKDLYTAVGDTLKAYYALERYLALEDSLGMDRAIVELLRTQNEIQILKKDAEINRRRNNNILTLALSGCGIAMLLMGIFLFFQKKSIAIKKKDMELQRSQLMHEKAQQAIRSKSEKLELSAMQQYQLERLTEKTIGSLRQLSLKVKEPSIKSELNEICAELNRNREHEQWEDINRFVPCFGSDFNAKLLRDFPDLTINERRLCVLLNQNMTTKEIADITRQSVQSINKARIRLRNKLGITGEETSIQEFLAKYN